MNILNLIFEHNLFLQGKKEKRIEYGNILTKRRPDIQNVEEVVEEIINVPDSKLQKAMLYWTMKGTLTPPFDYAKLSQVMEVLRIKRADFQTYESPDQVLDQQQQILDSRPIDPNACPELTNKTELGNGVTVYDVQDDKAGQEKMRLIINTHVGPKANPWCLLHGDGKGNLSDGTNGLYNAWHYWNHYTSLKKRVAFQNGKLLAFSANDSVQLCWWDLQDNPHVDIPCKGMPVLDKEGYNMMPPKMRSELLARSAAISSDQLEKMLQQTADADALYNIALNPNTTPDQLLELSKSPHDIVRLAVAQNQNVTKQILKTLINDTNIIVVNHAKIALNGDYEIPENEVWSIVFGLPGETIFTMHYCYTDNRNVTATRRCQMHQNVNVKGVGVTTREAHAAWNNIKYWDLDKLEYRSCKIRNIIWIEFNGKRHKINHNMPTNIVPESKFNSIYNLLKK